MRFFRFGCLQAVVAAVLLSISPSQADDRVAEAHPGKTVIFSTTDAQALTTVLVPNYVNQANAVADIFNRIGMPDPAFAEMAVLELPKRLSEPGTGLLVSSEDSRHAMLDPLFDIPDMRIFIFEPSLSLKSASVQASDGSIIGSGERIRPRLSATHFIIANGTPGEALDTVLFPGAGPKGDIARLFEMSGLAVGSLKTLNTENALAALKGRMAIILDTNALRQPAFNAVAKLFSDPQIFTFEKAGRLVDVTPPLRQSAIDRMERLAEAKAAIPVETYETVDLTSSAIKAIEYQLAVRSHFRDEPDTKWDARTDRALGAFATAQGIEYSGLPTSTILSELAPIQDISPKRIGSGVTTDVDTRLPFLVLKGAKLGMMPLATGMFEARLDGVSLTQCMQECAANPRCTAVTVDTGTCELFATFSNWFDYSRIPDVSSAVVLRRDTGKARAADLISYADGILRDYTAAPDITAPLATLSDLPVLQGRSVVPLDEFQFLQKPEDDVRRRLPAVGGPASTGGFPPRYRDFDWILVSDAHANAIAKWVRLAEQNAPVTPELTTLFEAAVADARDRFGEASPLIAPIVFDMAHLTTDTSNGATLSWEGAESQRITLLKSAAELLPFAVPEGSEQDQRTFHQFAAATLIGSLAFDEAWYSRPENLSIEVFLETQGGVCRVEPQQNLEISQSIIGVVKSDAELRGVVPEHIGWLRAASVCLEDRGLARDILSSRVRLALALGDDAIVADTLADLAFKMYKSGDVDIARETLQAAIARDLPKIAEGNLGTFILNETNSYHLTEHGPELDSPSSHWQLLRPLGMEAEIDLLIAGLFSGLQTRDLQDFSQRSGMLEYARLILASDDMRLKSDVLTYFDQEIGAFSEASALGALVFIFNDAFGAQMEGGPQVLEDAAAFLEDAPADTVLAYQTARAALLAAQGKLSESAAAAGDAVSAATGRQSTLRDDDLNKLAGLVLTQRRELGDVTGLADSIVASLQGELRPACNGQVSIRAFPWLPLDKFHEDPLLSSAVQDTGFGSAYIRCFERNIARLAYRDWGTNYLPADRILDVFYLLGIRNLRTDAEALMDQILSGTFWNDERGGDRGGLAVATSAVIDGLRLAGKESWLEGRTDIRVPAFATDAYPLQFAALGRLGFSFDAIGRSEDARAIYDFLTGPDDSEYTAARCEEFFGACIFVAAFEEKYFEREHQMEDFSHLVGNELFFPPEDTPFATEVDPGLKRRDGSLAVSLHRATGMDFAASLIARALYSPVGAPISNAPIEAYLSAFDDLESEAVIRLLSDAAAQRLAEGDTEGSLRLSGRVLDRLIERTSGFAVFGDDPLVRQATRLRPLLETHLLAGTTDESQAREQISDEFLGNIFAAQVLQASSTTASFAKLSSRAFVDARPELRRLQDVTNQLSDEVSNFVSAGANAQSERIPALEAERDELIAYLEETDPELLARASVRLPTPDDIIDILRPKEGLLSYYVADSATFVWLFTNEGIVSKRLDLSRDDIETLVAEARMSIASVEGLSELDLGALYRPYEALLAPVADQASSLETLIFVPSGPLSALPWATLLQEPPAVPLVQADDIRDLNLPWLVRRFELAQVPSLAAAHFLRTTPREDLSNSADFFGLGRPDFGDGVVVNPERPARRGVPFTALPETFAEIDGLARLYGADTKRDILLDENATEKRLRAAPLRDYRVLVMATHGVLSDEVPGLNEPALILTPGPAQSPPENDGILRASEIFGLDLNAEIVILTACNTAGSNGLPGSEGLSGIASSFFYAGARSLVVTHWKIPSLAAVEVSLNSATLHNEGRSPTWSGAIREATLYMIDRSPGDGKAHPINWGAYTYVGMP